MTESTARALTRATVAVLADAPGPGGRLLELRLGTGRLAILLLQRGGHVDGIEASRAMIDRLHAQPGSSRVGVYCADLAEFNLPRRDYDVAVCGASGRTLSRSTSRILVGSFGQ